MLPNGRGESDTVLLDSILPDTVLPDTGLIDTVLPDTVLPNTVLSDTVLPDTVLPDTSYPTPAYRTPENPINVANLVVNKHYFYRGLIQNRFPLAFSRVEFVLCPIAFSKTNNNNNKKTNKQINPAMQQEGRRSAVYIPHLLPADG